MATKKTTNNIVDPGPHITVDNISLIHKNFIDAVHKKQDITLKTKSIENIDLAGIQFILFAQKHAKMNNINLTFEIRFSENAESLLNNCGFANLLSL